ncbi:MAG: flavodoxin family protein [Staphylothermus sp.]|nr:flavodoxin family protein [Staphylothermus sp.]
MSVAIVYYSKTGRTRQVARIIEEKLVEQGFRADVYEVKHAKEYARWLLHFNPRLIRDTLSSKQVEIEVVPRFDPSIYDIIILGSPIWYDKIVPAIRTLLTQYRDILNKPVACYTTSILRRNYADGFKTLLESQGYRVISCVSIYNPGKDKDAINKLVNSIVEYLKNH